MYVVAALIIAYLLGSISFAVIVSRLMGLQDPRAYGSKNPGATNVLRSGNKIAALLTLLGDCLKGYFAVLLVQWGASELGVVNVWMTAGAGVAVFLGHLYPVFLRFKGGKGVATALGVILAFEPLLAVGVLLTWVVVVYLFRYSSLGAMVSALLAPFFYLSFDKTLWVVYPEFALVMAFLALMLLYRHTDNINNLIRGRESKVGSKKKSLTS